MLYVPNCILLGTVLDKKKIGLLNLSKNNYFRISYPELLTFLAIILSSFKL